MLSMMLEPSVGCYETTLLGRFDRRFLKGRVARGALGVILAAVLIVPSVQFVQNIRKIDKSVWRTGGERHRTALGRWLPTAAALADPTAAENPYGPGHWFPTPPLVLITLIPLAKMGYTGAGALWAALKILGFTIALALLIRELGRNAMAIPVGVLVMAGVFGLRPIVSDLQHGNLNIFMLVWMALAWAFYVRGRDFWAGVLLALAIVTKLTPALMLLYFLFKRSWRVCVGAAVGLILFLLVVPSLYLGFARNLELLQSWFDMLVAPYALQGYATLEIPNQALYGVLLRLLSNAHILSVEHMPDEQAWAVGMEMMARPASTLGLLLRPATTIVVLGLLAWLCRRRCAFRRDPRLLLEFAAALLAMLLLSERTWKHHATTLPIVFLGVWYALTTLPWSARFREAFVAGLVVQWLLLVGTTEGLLGDEVADILLDGGFFCWGLVLCLLQIGVLLRHMDRCGCASKEPAALAAG
jgi:hypothetical protein